MRRNSLRLSHLHFQGFEHKDVQSNRSVCVPDFSECRPDELPQIWNTTVYKLVEKTLRHHL